MVQQKKIIIFVISKSAEAPAKRIHLTNKPPQKETSRLKGHKSILIWHYDKRTNDKSLRPGIM